MKKEKLMEYIRGEVSSNDGIVKILNWIEQDETNRKEYNSLKNLWVATGLQNIDEDANALSFEREKTVHLRYRKLQLWLNQYAAIFLIAFILGGVALYLTTRILSDNYTTVYNQIEVPRGERSLITLYDGTKVWLNSGTTLKYPVNFSKKQRKVFINGEAYFDVAKKRKQPFVINAKNFEVEVLGTKFNLSAYDDDPEFSVTLDEGRVKTFSVKNKEGEILKPGEQVIYNRRSDIFQKNKVDTRIYSTWKESLLKFENADFDEVIKKMERWYDVDIQLEPSVNTGQRYTMTIKTESLKEMLELLTKTTNINYEIKEDQVLIRKP